MKDRIVAYLYGRQQAWTVLEIAEGIGELQGPVVEALIQLQDDDRVLMRNGYYWLSEAERKRWGAA